jgi:hypothetical protein
MKKISVDRRLRLGACACVLFASTSARAESLFGNRESFWQGELGLRTQFVKDAGYDPFATNDAYSQFSLGVTRTIWSEDRLSFAPGLIWDYGGRSASARGLNASLSTHRLAASLEGRYHLFPWAYGLVRLTPGALHQAAEVEDSVAPASFVATKWVFAFDASAGAVFLIGPHAEETQSPVRWWAGAEGGYAYAGRASLTMHPDLPENDPRRTGDLNLGTLAMSGGFFRVYGCVTY